MYKVVINGCYGGFSLSEKASNYLINKYGIDIDPKYGYLPDDFQRHDKRLVEVVEFLGQSEASGDCARLVIETIYDPIYRVSEYDGYESIHTQDMDEDWVVIKDNT